MLTRRGHHALFVGGCVRNALLGLPVRDVDIATEARPQRVIELAQQAGLKPVPTGLAHGTITVISDGVAHEVTTFRRDVETDGRRAVIAFADDVHDDARRRDFTMNALYATPEGDVVDPLGSGLEDLAARRLRFVGTPENRIREDYLRILRFFRFHAWYGDAEAGPDPDALSACASLVPGLDVLSRERVGAEMRRLLDAPDPAPAVATMARIGVLAHVLPGATPDALACLVHLEGQAGLAPAWLRRLACIGGQDPVTALRLSREAGRGLVRLQRAMASADPPAALGYWFGTQVACDAVVLRAAMTGVQPEPDFRAQVARGAQMQFPLRAADLMPHYRGAALGRRLTELEARWVASGFTLTRAQLLG